MRLHEFADPTRYFPSKIETAKTAECTERNPLHNTEDDAARRQTKNSQTKKMAPLDTR